MCSLRYTLRNVRLFVQQAARKMCTTGTPLTYMCDLVTETLHTLCALKTEVSIPTLNKSDLIHLATVTVDTGLQGLIN